MKLILLRHEERTSDISFYSELTEEGIINSLNIPNNIKSQGVNKIDVIYCSPFIRTLQTSYTCSKKFRKKINLEYALYEYLHNPFFLLYNWYYEKSDIKDTKLLSIINNNYKSIVTCNDFIVLEDEINLEKRIIKFFNVINTIDKNKTVLIVTHKGVINKIKDLYFKKTSMDDEFPMGYFECYDL